MSRIEYLNLDAEVRRGNITRGEAHRILDVQILVEYADAARDARRHAEYLRERRTIIVPREVSELDLLQAVASAVNEADEAVRQYTWYREAVERGEDPESDGCHEDYFGHATCDEIAAVLVGVAIKDGWKVRNPRRVVSHLGKLARAGFICRGERHGQPYGYELTLDGIDFLVDAGAIDRLEEVAA